MWWMFDFLNFPSQVSFMTLIFLKSGNKFLVTFLDLNGMSISAVFFVHLLLFQTYLQFEWYNIAQAFESPSCTNYLLELYFQTCTFNWGQFAFINNLVTIISSGLNLTIKENYVSYHLIGKPRILGILAKCTDESDSRQTNLFVI